MGDNLIIGLTGKNAAGKGAVSEVLEEKGFKYYSLSDVIREEADKRGLEHSRENLIRLGNELRENGGESVLADLTAEKIKKISKDREERKVVVDSIRHPAEVERLREEKDFVLVGVTAPVEERFKRAMSRGRNEDCDSLEGFKALEEKEESSDSEKQQLSRTFEMRDKTIKNDGTLKELKKRINRKLLEEDNMSKNDDEEVKDDFERLPWDEYFFKIMEAVSMRASCDRGRMGAVLARDKRLLTTGYVGAPAGLPDCDEVGHMFKKKIHNNGDVSKHCVRTTHAELNAIIQAAKHGITTEEATLYCKMTPCLSCTKAIINAGIERVVCQKRYHSDKDSMKMLEQADIEIDIQDNTVEEYEGQRFE